jgi:hypothetical protein
MTCCDYGKCTNGPDCPVRKQRIKEINNAYTNGYNDARLDDPYEDVFGTFRALVIVLAVCIAVTLLSYVLWGKT